MKDLFNKPVSHQRLNIDITKLSIQDLQDLAHKYGVIGVRYLGRDELILKINELEENPEKEIEVEGILEKMPDGYGFLRLLRSDYMSSHDDIYVSHNLIRKYISTLKDHVRAKNILHCQKLI